MSWPEDGEPRFIVTSVSGYKIDPATTPGRARELVNPPVCYAILDRAYAHKVVAEFIPGPGGDSRSGKYGSPGPDLSKAPGSEGCRYRAEQLCAQLNAKDALGVLDEDAA